MVLDIKYFLFFKENGNCICGINQKNTDDTIGRKAIENIHLNSIIAICVDKLTYDKFEIDKIKAKDLYEYLIDNGITPY